MMMKITTARMMIMIIMMIMMIMITICVWRETEKQCGEWRPSKMRTTMQLQSMMIVIDEHLEKCDDQRMTMLMTNSLETRSELQ